MQENACGQYLELSGFFPQFLVEAFVLGSGLQDEIRVVARPKSLI